MLSVTGDTEICEFCELPVSSSALRLKMDTSLCRPDRWTEDLNDRKT